MTGFEPWTSDIGSDCSTIFFTDLLFTLINFSKMRSPTAQLMTISNYLVAFVKRDLDVGSDFGCDLIGRAKPLLRPFSNNLPLKEGQVRNQLCSAKLLESFFLRSSQRSFIFHSYPE